MLTRAREEAIAIQDLRGVLFYIDPVTDRVAAAFVQAAQIQDSAAVTTAAAGVSQQPYVLLDLVANRDSVWMPAGVRVQTIINGVNLYSTPASEASNSSHGNDDRYLGYNGIAGTNLSGSGQQFNVGGCILFDGSGKLVCKPYGFQMTQPAYAGVTMIPAQQVNIPSNLYNLFFNPDPNKIGPNNPYLQVDTYINVGTIAPLPPPPAQAANLGSAAFIPGASNKILPVAPLLSQVGLVLFDRDRFQSAGFTDSDSCITFGGTPYNSPNANGFSEADEENWIDQNSTALLISRYNGTLIRSE